jgi:hypothetical protein
MGIYNSEVDLIAEAYMSKIVDQNLTTESCQDGEDDPTEIKMALSELKRAKEYAGKLEVLLRSVNGLEGWTAAKITKASDYLSSVCHWLEFEASEDGNCNSSQVSPGYADGEINQFEDGE